MTKEDASAGYRGMIASIGKVGAQALFPDDFEVYFTALELVDSNKKTVDYFAFPINPNSITETHPQLTNIKKTAGGITTLSTPTFVAKDITINGNFGRNFKVLLGKEDGLSTFSGIFSDGRDVSTADFNKFIKTGFGCIKVLQRIIARAQSIDDATNNTFSLYFYNLSFGTSYLVRPQNLTFSQTTENNMIWQYSLNLKAIAPLAQIATNPSSTKGSPIDSLGTKAIQGSASSIANALSGLVF